LDDEEGVWIGFLTAIEALDKEELTKLVPLEFYKFLNLFAEPLAHKLPPHRFFDHQIHDKEWRYRLIPFIICQKNN
jgi:hypothetical protein